MSKNSEDLNKSADLLKSLGGPIGILESMVPGTVYVVLFGLTTNVVLAAWVAGATSAVFAIYQIIKKRPLTQVLAGLVGLGLSIYLPLRNGLNDTHAADYFIPGLLTNIGYAAGFATSLLIRKPLAAYAFGFLSVNARDWRSNKTTYRKFYWITAMWFGMFVTRLLIEVPLYLAGQVSSLGIAKLVLGTPFYALIVWFSWLMARDTITGKK